MKFAYFATFWGTEIWEDSFSVLFSILLKLSQFAVSAFQKEKWQHSVKACIPGNFDPWFRKFRILILFPDFKSKLFLVDGFYLKNQSFLYNVFQKNVFRNVFRNAFPDVLA